MSIDITIIDSKKGRGCCFLHFSLLMTCQTNQPPPPPCLLTLPRARFHPHRPRAPPPPSRYTPTRTQTHTHTFSVSALPIQTTDSGGSERERGVSRAASMLTQPQPSLSQCRSYVIYICVLLAMWSIGGGVGGVIQDTRAPIYFCACILGSVLVNYVWPRSEI